MQDKEIRKILIEYLKIKHKEYRIYQEKSIGSSICDLMLVTDKLTGFEIKSDSDNYERLPRQVTAYNQFFDENYIVVGMSHAKSVESKLPPEWGILAINQYSIEVGFMFKNLVQRSDMLTAISPELRILVDVSVLRKKDAFVFRGMKDFERYISEKNPFEKG